MPIYEYRCDDGHVFEVRQRMVDDPVETCTTCEAPVQRVFHPVAVHFKGSGFYNTDYGKRGRGSSAEGDGGNEGGGSGDGDAKKSADGSGSGESTGSSSDSKGSGESKGSAESKGSGDSKGSKTASSAASSS